MFSAKHVIVALTLAFLAINAVECGSQCHNWLANGGKSSAPKQVIAKMVSDHRIIMHPQSNTFPDDSSRGDVR
jgi:hypothetical protein